MGFADELAKNTKSKQQIKAEKQAQEAKLYNAWQAVLPDIVEYEALEILRFCTETAKGGKRSYAHCFKAPDFFRHYCDAPLRVVDLCGGVKFSYTQEPQAYLDAGEYYEANGGSELITALMDRLRKEGLDVKLSSGSLLGLINDGPRTYIKIKW